MPPVADDAPGRTKLLMGNEAIARGAMEAGVGVATAYPGTPSTEIIETLAKAARKLNIYVEWSINEKVAVEAAAAASFAGLRAITAMKQNGLDVALDFLANSNLSGVNKGLVVAVCDDAGGLSGTNEQDTRYLAKMLDLPLLEPATVQEAKDMTKWAFELSEEIANTVILRSVTRISHARGNVVLGKLPKAEKQAYFDTTREPYEGIRAGAPQYHKKLHENLAKVRQIYESSPFNWYVGPQNPELLIITCGSGWLYTTEAIKLLSAEKSAGILKLGTTWPLPPELIKKHMLETEQVLIIEEVDAFLESNIKELSADIKLGKTWTFYGKASGHTHPFGELNPDTVIRAIADILSIEYTTREPHYRQKSQDNIQKYVIPRELQFCAGCPHRATFWALKNALKLDGGEGVVTGDIGCYTLGLLSTGFYQLNTQHSMGSGAGVAIGLGKLNQFGFEQPVLATCGDSTFFHAAIPALINGVHNRSDFILMVLDNAGTAMTGFQPHPGTETDAVGDPVPPINIERLCQGLGVPVVVTDPYELQETTGRILDLIGDRGKPRVMIFQRECALARARREKPLYKMQVNPDKCIGEDCDCARFCTRVFKCPGLVWNKDRKKSEVDEAICVGCGVCADICPRSAIVKEECR